MFEKTLQDVVKGIRANKRDPSDFISATIAEIKVELKSSDAFVKAQAVRKLTYLQMLGYDMSWAAFYVVEVMTMPRFAHKRVGYLAANQCFTEDTEVVLLCTNHLQKEFKSQNPYDVGLAINCLANIATPGLSRDLISDLVQLLGNHKPYVRKKALLAMYKLFIKYPQGLRLTFDRIKERLEDSDNSVVSCAVNVICELADKNPKNYLAMAPQFFRLLTTSSNNWMLIKVVKLLGSLVPEEPRLARKLLEPLATIIQNTAAKSLLYECIHTMTLALPFTRKADGTESKAVPAAVRLCSDHLRKFTEDPDQNLKYLGLVGFVNLMRSHPRAVAEHRSLVLACLSDDDVTIRTRALELLSGMVTKRNLEDLVLNLLQHVARAEGSYRDELIAKIIFVCSRDKYAYMSNFRWYTGVLVDLSHVEGSKHGDALALQLMDVSLRVEEVREYAVHKAVGLLLDRSLITGRSSDTMQQVLRAAAWAVGEYSRPHLETLAKNHRRGERVWYDVIEALLAPEAVRLPARTQAVYVQNASKVLISMCSTCSDDGELGRTLEMVPGRFRALMRSPHIEVQERSTTYYHLLLSYSIIKEVEDDYDNGKVFQPGEEASTDEGTNAGKKGTGTEKASASKEGKGSTTSNGQVSAASEVLDLLGLDPQSLGGGAESVNGLKKPNGVAVGNDAGAARPLMLTQLAVAPSMLGPVGAARGAASEMAALSAEVLKPVNPRAQSRVPPPEDVDLDHVVNRSAFDKFLSFQDDGPTDLSRLSFTQIRVPKSEYEDYRFSSSQGRDADQDSGDKRGKKSSRKKDKDKRGGRDSRNDSATNGLGGGAGDDRNSRLGSPPQTSKTASDRYKSDPFYLPPGGSGGTKLIEFGGGREEATHYALPSGEQHRRHQQQQRNNYNYYDDEGDNSLMSNALAPRRDGSFDDEYGGHGRPSKARKDKDKHGRRKSARGETGSGGGEVVDNVELMPARAVKDSDDEYDDEPAGSRGRRNRKSASKGAPSGLAAIDITKPLDEGDVLPEIKPYVRLTAETARAMGNNSGRNTSDKNESRSHKRRGRGDGDSSSRRKGATSSRKHRSSKAKERSSTTIERNESGGEPEVDLIGWGTDPATAVDPPLLLQDAPSNNAASTADPVPAPAPAGKGMRAPPSSLQASTWESDLSAILSAAAPIAAAGPAAPIDAPVPTPPSVMAAEVTVITGADVGGSNGTDGDVGGEVESVGSMVRNTRRKSGGSSSKARKERSNSKPSKKSSKEKKEKKRSRRIVES